MIVARASPMIGMMVAPAIAVHRRTRDAGSVIVMRAALIAVVVGLRGDRAVLVARDRPERARTSIGRALVHIVVLRGGFSEMLEGPAGVATRRAAAVG